jgi:hypothetical protein
LLAEQALSWFAHLFEREASILNNFEAFLTTLAAAFEDHDKARSATTKICILWQGHALHLYMRRTLDYLHVIIIGTKRCL